MRNAHSACRYGQTSIPEEQDRSRGTPFGKRRYGITVAGLGIGGVGASTLRATGTVYGLRNVNDFTGAYVQLWKGWALGDRGRGRLWLRNATGVTLRLETQHSGLQFSLGADGVLIGFTQ